MAAVKDQENGGPLNALKWAAVAFLVAVGVAGNQYFSGESLLYRVLALLALGLVALAVALRTSQGRSFWNLATEARAEIRKVVWPTRQETTQTTLVVLVIVLIMAVILWGLDTLFGWLLSLLIG
ncbi:MAG: preprotein translocase subunit SecE [Pseudomonadota bacterium]|nr:preprotein translocase subunit SecE [Pseudomonadota bacterium]